MAIAAVYQMIFNAYRHAITIPVVVLVAAATTPPSAEERTIGRYDVVVVLYLAPIHPISTESTSHRIAVLPLKRHHARDVMRTEA